ncbi:PREDICTED: uncharacterized protein LOC105116791 [Populus euphratica]|uniref:Uncharacterized protein LOC105116791 n=1 Tax=Populus euphratica TaxID=75702 RepID=A0AAJ6TJY5_POPEU|nr:PREDICTED: uncharacterized protein LOC105116791 [Populus euphratica]
MDQHSIRTGSKIMRKSIYTYLQNYHYYTLTSALLAFPFSASSLFAQLLLVSPSSSLLAIIYNRLNRFPYSWELIDLVNLKLSQTISFFILTLPLNSTLFLIAKASVIQVVNRHKPPSFCCIFSIFNPLLLTYVSNSLLILSANATAFCLLSIAFNPFHDHIGFGSLFLSAAGAVVYSIILANVIIICNLALVISGMERFGGYLAILKACVMIRGRASTALSLTLAVNTALAGVEALFQYRIVRAYDDIGETPSSLLIISEGMLIVYLYSILVVLDTIISCIFFKSCKATSSFIDQQGKYAYRIIVIEGEEDGALMSLKA